MIKCKVGYSQFVDLYGTGKITECVYSMPVTSANPFIMVGTDYPNSPIAFVVTSEEAPVDLATDIPVAFEVDYVASAL